MGMLFFKLCLFLTVVCVFLVVGWLIFFSSFYNRYLSVTSVEKKKTGLINATCSGGPLSKFSEISLITLQVGSLQQLYLYPIIIKPQI